MAGGWTFETLKEYIESRFEGQDKAVRAALAAAEEARKQAEANAEKWRANANEWRDAMNDREAKFASKPEMEGELRAIRSQIASLKESRDMGIGRSAVLATVVSVAIGLLMMFAGKYLGR
jgi:hypothetical protein